MTPTTLYVMHLRWDGGEQDWLACGETPREAADTLRDGVARYTSRQMRQAGKRSGTPTVRVEPNIDGEWYLKLDWPTPQEPEFDPLELLVLRSGTCVVDGRML